MARARHRPIGFAQPSGADVWEIGLTAMPATVPGDDGQPVRPLVAMVVESSGRVRGSAIGHPDRPLEALEPAIEMAIEEPQAPCLPGRPRRVVVGSSRLLKLVPPLLPGVMVTRGDTPHLDHVTSSLRNHIAADGDQPGQQGLSTYLSADVTAEAVASFFKAAAALYERRPWERVPSDGHLFTISCPALRIKGWAGCVIGQNRENYGVILFQSVADYDRYVELAERSEAEGLEVMDGAPPHRAINFESKRDMPPALLEEIRRYRWPVAKGDAYPTVMLVQPNLGLAPPTRADLAQFEAMAGALTQWLDSEPDLARCWAGPNGRRRRFRVPVGPMEVPVTIGVAAEAIQSPDPQLDDSPMVWMVEVDGFIRDVRQLPLEIQVEACAKGLIPYVPAMRD